MHDAHLGELIFFFFLVRYALVVLVDLLSVLFNSICRGDISLEK